MEAGPLKRHGGPVPKQITELDQLGIGRVGSDPGAPGMASGRIGTKQLPKHCKRDQPELTRHALEALRQPLEDGTVTIARARSTVCFPASFLLVAGP